MLSGDDKDAKTAKTAKTASPSRLAPLAKDIKNIKDINPSRLMFLRPLPDIRFPIQAEGVQVHAGRLP